MESAITAIRAPHVVPNNNQPTLTTATPIFSKRDCDHRWVVPRYSALHYFAAECRNDEAFQQFLEMGIWPPLRSACEVIPIDRTFADRKLHLPKPLPVRLFV